MLIIQRIKLEIQRMKLEIQRIKFEFQRLIFEFQRKKGRDLTQSYDKSPYTHRKKNPKSIVTTEKRHQKL